MIVRLQLVAVFVLLSTSAWSDTRLRFDVVPAGGYSFGTTRYRMDATTVISQLDFPLDQIVAGGRVELAKLRDSRPDWSVSAEIWHALGDPKGTFDDRDWEVAGDGTEFLFSSTESHVDGSMTRLRGEITKTALRGGMWDIAVFAGFTYQKIAQTAIDVSGFQYVTDSGGGGWVYFDYSVRALTYDIEFYQSLVGLAPRLYPDPRIVIEARLALSPVLYTKDLDNHLLRGFISESAGYGFGTAARMAVRFEPTQHVRDGRFFVMLAGDYYHARTDHPTVVKWYRDVEEESRSAGDILYGVPHEIVSNQFALSLQIGLTF